MWVSFSLTSLFLYLQKTSHEPLRDCNTLYQKILLNSVGRFRSPYEQYIHTFVLRILFLNMLLNYNYAIKSLNLVEQIKQLIRQIKHGKDTKQRCL